MCTLTRVCAHAVSLAGPASAKCRGNEGRARSESGWWCKEGRLGSFSSGHSGSPLSVEASTDLNKQATVT